VSLKSPLAVLCASSPDETSIGFMPAAVTALAES